MIDLAELLHMTFLFLIVLDPLGNVPVFVNILKPFDPVRQKQIIVRELLIALAVMLIFVLFGQGFFQLLNIKGPSLEMTGGVILFIIAIRMIFSSPRHETVKRTPKEPLIVPLAIPAVAGPAILATITLYGGVEGQKLTAFIAVILTWAVAFPILLSSLTLKKILGENGTVAFERLFGYIVVLISTRMVIEGLTHALAN